MVKCSKCGIIIVPGDYVEIKGKPVCLACALKKGKISHKHITGFLERLFKKLPFGLQVIMFLVLLSAIYSLSISTKFSGFFRGLELVIAILLFILFFGLTFLLNFARISLLFLMSLLIFLDFYLFINNPLNYIYLIRIVIGSFIIVYLLIPKIKKYFV